MPSHSRFVIENDLSRPLIVNIEPESVQIALACGEKVTVEDRFDTEPSDSEGRV